MPTMLNDDGMTGNARVDAALKKGNGQKPHNEGPAGPSMANSAKQKAAELKEKTGGLIGHWPYTSVIATFALGLFFGAMAGGK